MAFADVINKQVRYKKQTAMGTLPGATGAQLLRRTESNLKLSKDTYQSNEMRTDRQDIDFRHGVRRTDGTLGGEVSPGTYKDFIAAALCKDFAATAAMTGLSITIAAGTAPTYTLTRSTGSYITSGLKVGDVIRLTAGTFNAANLNKNLLVVGLTALVATVVVVNASTLVAEGPIATATVSVPGKRSWIPQSGHTDDYFTFEHWFSDINQSELFTDCKIGSVEFNLPPTGMATVSLPLLGRDMTPATSAYFTSPTAETTAGIVAAINGALLVNGTLVAIVTGLSIKINPGNQARDPVIGSNSVPGIAPGTRIAVEGQLSLYFTDGTVRDYYANETAISLVAVLATSNDAAAEFIGFSLPKLKLNSDSKSDSDKGIIASHDFKALLNSAGGAAANTELTTLVVQDSLA